MEAVNGDERTPENHWQRPDAPLGTLIFREGLLSAEQLEEALGDAVKRGKRLGHVLVERGLLEESQVANLVARQKGFEYMDLVADAVDHETARLIPPETAWEYLVIPVRVERDQVVVAVEDPTDEEGLEALRAVIGRDVRFVVATRSAIQRVIGLVYDEAGSAPSASAASPPASEPLLATDGPGVPPLVEPDTGASEPGIEETSAPLFAAAPLADVTPLRTVAPLAEPTAGAPGPQESEPLPAAEPVVQAVASEEPAVLASVEPVATEVPEASGRAVYDPPPGAVELQAQVVPGTIVSEPFVLQADTPEEPSAASVELAFEPSSEPAPLMFVAPPVPEPEVSVEELAPEPEGPPAEVSADPERTSDGALEQTGSTYEVVVRLTDGDEIACGTHATPELAKDAARTLTREVGSGEWPELGDRFVRPELIASVEVAAST